MKAALLAFVMAAIVAAGCSKRAPEESGSEPFGVQEAPSRPADEDAGETLDGQRFLDRYGGQTTDELIGLAGEYRIDSVVLAFEEAIQRKAARQPISKEESYVLAVEALEREVNNGGYSQFFLNSSNEFAAIIVEALREIGCPKTAEITQGAISALHIEGEPTAGKVEAVARSEDEGILNSLGAFDDRYYGNDEPIAERLFEWIKQNRTRIRIGLP